MVMEAEKSHGVPSKSWRTKKASDIVQSKAEALWGGGVQHWRKSQSPKAQEPGALMSEGRRRWTSREERGRVCASSVFLFYSGP